MGRIVDNKRVRLHLFACASFMLATTAGGHEVIPDFYKEPGLNPNRSFVNQNFNEHIDPFTGALQLHYVDVHVPGNGGFDLSVTRSYSSASIDETIRLPSSARPGWGGRSTSDACSTRTACCRARRARSASMC